MNGRKIAHRASSVHASENVTGNLQKFTTGDREAGQEVFPVLEVELRRLAAHCMRREGANHTLQPTALVNEAFLRIFHKARRPWSSREHFLADASRTMRRVLVGYARKHRSQKRSGERLTLESCHLGVEAVSVDVIHIHDLLDELTAIAPRQAQLVELRFFGGCSLEEAAVIAGISPRLADKDWALTRAWLKNRLDSNRQSENAPA